jgi:glycerol-3-phosphate dehydrogenase
MSLRATHKLQLQDGEFDVLVIGAGINGAASASALAHRGLRTALVDARDFAGYTSQNSSNLIWGGIKYLETFEFAGDPLFGGYLTYGAALAPGSLVGGLALLVSG